ncbi:hypothetical protein [Kurthia huakuii]|uniref:hypothetical protein n=1 Tax=Kurthia huakuii TaxID=1421019 RepID=UPI00049728FA|nr:hypothetical protein [Kurthia huakuii]MBM7701153.1 hypothetical protein [Kurthia huakuii]
MKKILVAVTAFFAIILGVNVDKTFAYPDASEDFKYQETSYFNPDTKLEFSEKLKKKIIKEKSLPHTKTKIGATYKASLANDFGHMDEVIYISNGKKTVDLHYYCQHNNYYCSKERKAFDKLSTEAKKKYKVVAIEWDAYRKMFTAESISKTLGKPIATPKKMIATTNAGVYKVGDYYMLLAVIKDIHANEVEGDESSSHIIYGTADALRKLALNNKKIGDELSPIELPANIKGGIVTKKPTYYVVKNKIYVTKTGKLYTKLIHFKSHWYYKGKKVKDSKLKKKPEFKEVKAKEAFYVKKDGKYIVPLNEDLGMNLKLSLYPDFSAEDNLGRKIKVKTSLKKDGKKVSGISYEEPGNYTITYKATDYAGQTATNKISFIVLKKEKSIVQLDDIKIEKTKDSIKLKNKVKIKLQASGSTYKKKENIIWGVVGKDYTGRYSEHELKTAELGLRKISDYEYEFQGFSEETRTTIRQKVIFTPNSYFVEFTNNLVPNITLSSHNIENDQLLSVAQQALVSMYEKQTLLSAKDLLLGHVTGSVKAAAEQALLTKYFDGIGFNNDTLATCISGIIVGRLNGDFIGVAQSSKACGNEIVATFSDVFAPIPNTRE